MLQKETDQCNCTAIVALLTTIIRWRRLEIIWIEYLRRIKEGMNIWHKIKERKANWIGHILFRNCLLKDNIEEKIEGQRRGRRRRRHVLNDFMGKTRYWNF